MTKEASIAFDALRASFRKLAGPVLLNGPASVPSLELPKLVQMFQCFVTRIIKTCGNATFSPIFLSNYDILPYSVLQCSLLLAMEKDLESSTSTKLSHWKLITSHIRITPEVLAHTYTGAGTINNPFIVTWIPNDPGNPMSFSNVRKWFNTFITAISALAVAFSSTAYVGK